jgi:hypothetical protein
MWHAPGTTSKARFSMTANAMPSGASPIAWFGGTHRPLDDQVIDQHAAVVLALVCNPDARDTAGILPTNEGSRHDRSQQQVAGREELVQHGGSVEILSPNARTQIGNRERDIDEPQIGVRVEA